MYIYMYIYTYRANPVAFKGCSESVIARLA